jgi:hypothetical protein
MSEFEKFVRSLPWWGRCFFAVTCLTVPGMVLAFWVVYLIGLSDEG